MHQAEAQQAWARVQLNLHVLGVSGTRNYMPEYVGLLKLWLLKIN